MAIDVTGTSTSRPALLLGLSYIIYLCVLLIYAPMAFVWTLGTSISKWSALHNILMCLVTYALVALMWTGTSISWSAHPGRFPYKPRPPKPGLGTLEVISSKSGFWNSFRSDETLCFAFDCVPLLMLSILWPRTLYMQFLFRT
jgi:hypothetical protein